MRLKFQSDKSVPGPSPLETEFAECSAPPIARERLPISQALLPAAVQQNMQRRRGARSLVAALLMFSDFASCALALIFANLIYLGNIEWHNIGNIIALCGPIFMLSSINNNAHNAIYTLHYWTGVGKALTALVLAGAFLMFTWFLLKAGAEYSRGMMIIGGVLCLIALPCGRALVSMAMHKRVSGGLYAQVCIFDGIPVKNVAGVVSVDAQALGLRPQLDSSDMISRLGMLASGLDRVIVCCRSENRAEWVMVLKALDVPCEISLPELEPYHALSISRFDSASTLVLNTGMLGWNQRLIKRAFDIVFSVLALLALSPILIAVSVAIRIDSQGPILFRQERIGLGNRRFKLLKFRSMYQEKSDLLGAQLTLRHDPRVTKVGALIRRTSIDELPQLINVLLGDMSVVGPRPHATEARAGGLLYWEVDSSYWHRHVVKPGITGLAQISGYRGNTFHQDDLQKRLDADLFYVNNWSFWEDIRILFKTFSVVSHANAF
jgi:exopolysaccharide biosynthesis polyprenyl glycosylphosphotransferase